MSLCGFPSSKRAVSILCINLFVDCFQTDDMKDASGLQLGDIHACVRDMHQTYVRMVTAGPAGVGVGPTQLKAVRDKYAHERFLSVSLLQPAPS